MPGPPLVPFMCKNMIPGLCQLWARKIDAEGMQSDWFDVPSYLCSYDDCEQLMEIYQEQWGTMYSFRILSAADKSLRTI